MKDWVHLSCVVTVEGFESFTWTVRGPRMIPPLPDCYPISPRANVPTSRLLLCSALFDVTSVGGHLLKQGPWQWHVIPGWLPKMRIRRPFNSFCCGSALESVSASSRWTKSIHSQKFIHHNVGILIWVPLGRWRKVILRNPSLSEQKGKEGATTVVLMWPFFPLSSWKYFMSSETSWSHRYWIVWVMCANINAIL